MHTEHYKINLRYISLSEVWLQNPCTTSQQLDTQLALGECLVNGYHNHVEQIFCNTDIWKNCSDLKLEKQGYKQSCFPYIYVLVFNTASAV